jgi:hypothetical protein
VKAKAWWASCCAALLATVAVGCDGAAGRNVERRLASERPQDRAGAVASLVQGRHPDDMVHLIHLLADPDEGVRFFAAAGLHRRTGERFGYSPEAPLRERETAIAEWVRWYCREHPEAGPRFEALLAGLKTQEQEPSLPNGEGPSS